MTRLRIPPRGNPYSRFERPLRLSERIVATPPHRDYSPKGNELVIKIDPGIAFGTGTHPTTGLCLVMIENYLKAGDRLLDVGTGTGILMIAAAKLGAYKALGIDKDALAVEAARQNLLLNCIEEEKFQVRQGNLLDGVREKFDLVVANILTEVIFHLLDDIGNVLKESGIFVCSGMIQKNTHRVVSKMKSLGLEILESRTKQYWVAMAAEQTQPP